MLIQCITLVKIHCITCITLNYCLTEISLLKTNCRVLNPQEGDPMKDLLPDRQEYLSCYISLLGVNYNSGEIYIFIHTFCSLH